MIPAQQRPRFPRWVRKCAGAFRRASLLLEAPGGDRRLGQRLSLLSLLLLSTVASRTPSLSRNVERFQTLTAWVIETGSPRVLDKVPIRAEATAAKMRVIARTADEPQLNLQHVICVGAAPRDRRFVFFIVTDTVDKSSTIWRASTEGKLLSTLCSAGGASRAVPNTEFATAFLVEREFFLRTLQMIRQPDSEKHEKPPQRR